jgi:hypothetical protein
MTNANSDVPAPERPGLDDRLQALVEAGLIEWSGHRLEPITPAACTKGEKTVADLLIEDRDRGSSMSLATPFLLCRSLC